MNIQKKIKQFEKQGYTGIDPQSFEAFLAYYFKQKHISGYFAKKKALKQLTANEFLDYEQMKVETADESQFNWHDIQDLF